MGQWFLSHWMTDGERLQNALEVAVAAFEMREDINNGVATALSKRFMKLIPAYDKILGGGRLQSTSGLRRCADGAPILMRGRNGC